MAKFVNELNLKQVLEFLAERFDEVVEFDIATLISDESTNEEAAGALAVYEFVTGIFDEITQISYEVVTALPTEGVAGRLYLIRVSTDPELYELSIFVDNAWRTVGHAELDLTNFWSKDELIAMANTEIEDLLEEVFG